MVLGGITRVLQRESNRAWLAVCPPPQKKREIFKRWEVDRMPINSVRNPLSNPYERNSVLVFIHH